jgi:KaiC/GvpD/RAD55 family RecA-like ATPase
VDVRNDGGYVVGPGSVVGDREYLVSKAEQFAALPEFFKKLKRQDRATDPSAARGGSGELGSITEGGRNAGLTKIAGSLRKQGLSQDGLISALMAINETECDPPLEAKEVETIAWSVARYAPDPDETPSHVEIKCQDLIEPMSEYLANKSKVIGQPTDIEGLDEFYKGYRGGEVTALNAKAKTGKSSLVHKMIHNLVKQGIPVGYASREMYPDKEVMPTLLSIDLQRDVRLEDPKPEDYSKAVANWPLFFSSGYGEFPFEDVEIWMKSLTEKYGVKHYFFDHLHYMASDSEDFKQVARLARTIKKLAMKLDVHVLLVVQPPKLQDGQVLGLDSLRGGAGVGQAVSSILTLDRVRGADGQAIRDIRKLELTDSRSTLTRPGKIFIKYHPKTNDFEEVEWKEEGAKPLATNWDSESHQVE